MRHTVLTLACIACALAVTGCASTSHDAPWRTTDEGTFTVELPAWLQREDVTGIDSHCGMYYSKRMVMKFDEVRFVPREEAKAAHDEFAQAFQATVQDESSDSFYRRVGQRYAHIKLEQDETLIKLGWPGKYIVDVTIPDPRRGYLSLYVYYRDPSDTPLALRIAKSVMFKSDDSGRNK